MTPLEKVAFLIFLAAALSVALGFAVDRLTAKRRRKPPQYFKYRLPLNHRYRG